MSKGNVSRRPKLSDLLAIQTRRNTMNKDRIEGSALQAKGAVKETLGNITGDAKLKADGKSDKAAGMIQNAIGGAKDTIKGA
jgi:uncharacterized protein YjbJ (UPF0337 family)